MKFLTIFLGCIFLSGCVAPVDTKEVQGILTIGHEVRSFRDYKTNKEYWIIDRSGTLLSKYYQGVGPNAVNYQPIFAVLKETLLIISPNSFWASAIYGEWKDPPIAS